MRPAESRLAFLSITLLQLLLLHDHAMAWSRLQLPASTRARHKLM
jgi:hypothetical protein